MTEPRKPLTKPVELPYTGGVPAPGSALTEEMLRHLGRPIPVVPPAADEPPEFTEAF